MRTLVRLLAILLLPLPAPAPAAPLPLGFSLESAVFERSGAAGLQLTAVASCWLEGGLESEARLGFGSADRPGGRPSAALVPALGLGWSPAPGRWRPLLGLEAGVVLPADAGPTRPTGAVRAGLRWFPRRDLFVSMGAAWRWTGGEAGGPEAVVGLGWSP